MQTASFFFFNDTATTEIYTLSLHDALPISGMYPHQIHRSPRSLAPESGKMPPKALRSACARHRVSRPPSRIYGRSEEHTSELQSLAYLVCRLLLEKKNNTEDTFS